MGSTPVPAADFQTRCTMGFLESFLGTLTHTPAVSSSERAGRDEAKEAPADTGQVAPLGADRQKDCHCA